MPILGTIASSTRQGLSTNSYESIASGGGAVSSVTFSSIPNTYKHLQIRFITRDNNASSLNNLVIRFNGDSASNYTDHYMLADNTGTGSGGSGGYDRGYIGLSASANTLANAVGVGVIEILDYANTSKFKTVRCLHGLNQNTTTASNVRFRSNAWLSTNAITSIQVFPDNNATFTSVTEIALYGLKGA